MQPDKIETIKDETILFIRKNGSYTQATNDAWRAMREFIKTSELNPLALRYFGISHDNPKVVPEEKLRYDAAILAPTIKPTGDALEGILKGGKYALFTHKGRYSNLEKTFSQILSKWLPKSGEKFDEARSSFCEYFDMEKMKTNPQDLITKIYIPLL